MFRILLLAVIGMGGLQMTGCKQKGCTDPYADNYDVDAKEDDGSCTYSNFNLSGTISTPTTWINRFEDPSMPDYILVGDVSIEALVTVEPGVLVQCNAGFEISVNGNGGLRAVGNSSDRIRFIGTSQVAGYWTGLTFNSSSAENRLDYVDVYYAGGSSFTLGAVGIGAYGRLGMSNTTISHTTYAGLYAGYQESELSVFENNNFRHCGTVPMDVAINQAVMVDGASTFESSNVLNYIRINGGTKQQPFTWRKAQVPYLINTPYYSPATAAGDVSVEAGTDFRFENGAVLRFDGVLTATGTANSPIRFDGRVQTPGFGGGLQVSASGSTMRHCIVSNLGNSGSAYGMVDIDSSTDLTASDCSFSNSGTWGIHLGISSVFIDGGGNTFSGNVSGDVSP